MKNSRRSFKNILIHRPSQLRTVSLIVVAGIVLSVLNTGVFYSYTKENYELLVDLSPMTDAARAQLYAELKHIVMMLSAFSLGFTAALAVVGLYLSHRTAGPLFHFKRVFDEINSGNAKARIKLRPRDDFQDVAESFNRMMDGVSGTREQESPKKLQDKLRSAS